MGCHMSKEDLENRKIELAQRDAEAMQTSTISLLLLGAGESGKSTLRTQLSRLHAKSLSRPQDRARYASTIVSNLHDSMLSLLDALAVKDEQVKEDEDMYRKHMAESSEFVPQACNDLIVKYLISGESALVIAQIMEDQYQDLQLPESFQYFLRRLDNYPAWGGEGWVPSEEDCIRSRSRTSGVIIEKFQANGVNFELYDVGGQRSERRKWLHNFQEVTAAIYVASLGDYDQVLYEDRSKNRLEESLELFQEAINSRWLQKTPTMLFLNKKDIFDRKFVEERIPLNTSGNFPDAPTDQDDPTGAIKWVGEQFKQRKLERKKRSNDSATNYQVQSAVANWFVHVTCATDEKNVDKVFKDCSSIILERNLNNLFGADAF